VNIYPQKNYNALSLYKFTTLQSPIGTNKTDTYLYADPERTA